MQVEQPARTSRISLLPTWMNGPIDVGAGPPQAREPDLRCMLALGAALLSYGLPAHRVEEALLRLGRAFGRRLSVFGLPTAVMITIYREQGADTYTARAEPSTIDLSRLDALHNLVARVERGELDAQAAEETTRRVLSAPRRYPAWLDMPAVASLTFGGALMLGAQPLDASFAALLGTLLGLLLAWSAKHFAIARIVPILGTVGVTYASCVLARSGLLIEPLLVAFAAMFILLPGLTLTLAMTELATGHLVSGATRCIAAGMVFFQLGFGILVGLRLAQTQVYEVIPAATASLTHASAGALLLVLGIAVLFVIRASDAPVTLLITGLAFYSCRLAGAWLGAEVGALVAATLVGLSSHLFARLRDRPSSTLTLPGVVMLVPGSMGIVAVSAVTLHDPSQALEMFFRMMMVVVGLSTGILVSSAALPPRTVM
jgi:uncharacterized membrane protein YjjP (DUF1212 family)